MTYWTHPGEPPAPSQPVYTGPPPTGQFPGGRPPVALNAWPTQYPMLPQGYASVAVEPRRPGSLTASAVIGYVTAGLLLIAGLALLSRTTFVSELAESEGTSSYIPELSVDAVLNMIVAGMLIGGGVALTAGRASGRSVYTVAAFVVLADAVYWPLRWRGPFGNGSHSWAVMFAALAVIGLALGWLPSASAWLRRPPGAAPAP